jgi:hypothetical protein
MSKQPAGMHEPNLNLRLEVTLAYCKWLFRGSLANSLLPGKLYGGKSASAFFSWCYDLRSRIVHRGTAGDDIDLWQLVSVTEEFVASLLLASLSAGAQQAVQPDSPVFGGPAT